MACSLIKMKREAKKIWLSYTFAMLLLSQIGFHAIHVINSHSLNESSAFTQHSNLHNFESLQDCELCAKLAGQSYSVVELPEILSVLAIPSYVSCFRSFIHHSNPLPTNSLRAPPLYRYFDLIYLT